MALDAVVTLTLTPTTPGTCPVLVRSGFEEQKQNLGGARHGWTTMGGKVVDLLGRIS